MTDDYASRYFDPDGNPITMHEWAAARESKDEDSTWAREHLVTKIAQGIDGDGITVSTVWLGLDHQWDPSGPPLIFETMIFGGVFNEEQWRYSTREEAHAGHAEAVRHAKAGIHAAFGTPEEADR